LLHVHGVHDAFDLLDVWPFMASELLRIRVHRTASMGETRQCRFDRATFGYIDISDEQHIISLY
jgi:hypothetical protein